MVLGPKATTYSEFHWKSFFPINPARLSDGTGVDGTLNDMTFVAVTEDLQAISDQAGHLSKLCQDGTALALKLVQRSGC